MVRGLPRSRGVLQRPLRSADQGADRHARGAGGSGLHLVPFDHARAAARWGRAISRSSIRRCTTSRRARTRCCGGRTTRCCTSRPSRIANTFIKPFHREQTAEFCSACHKVHLDVPVNGYRWFRGFNDYDNWQASGVSGQGARSFYYPAQPQKCADCHMPLVDSNDPAAKNGKVRSHRFPGANTALPFVNHDPVQLKAVQDFLRDGQISVDVFGITRAADTALPPRPQATRRRPSRRLVEHVRGRRGVGAVWRCGGHVDGAPRRSARAARQGSGRPCAAANRSVSKWSCARGRSAISSPAAPSTRSMSGWSSKPSMTKGACSCTAARRRTKAKVRWSPARISIAAFSSTSTAIPINKRNAWMTRSVAYVRLIPPGAADTVHYRLQIPDDAGDRITLRAKVNYRKFAWWNTQWAFAGVRDPSHAQPAGGAARTTTARGCSPAIRRRCRGRSRRFPTFPTTVMAQARRRCRVVGRARPLPDVKPLMDPSVRERWNDYGIGLLLQGDLKAARGGVHET